MNVLGTDTEDNFLAYISVKLAACTLVSGDRNLILVKVKCLVTAVLADSRVDEVHLG